MAPTRQFYFGDFRLDAVQRALFRKDELVPLTPKALETLLFLVERHGQIVEKKELMDAVWPETFVEEVSLARNISQVRKILSDSQDGREFIETIPKRGYRFVAHIEESHQVIRPSAPPEETPLQIVGQLGEKDAARARRRFWMIGALAIIAVVAAGTYWYVRHRPVLTDRDSIVLAEFTNTTGDPVFDGTLRQGLAVQLVQSPFLNLVSKERMRRALSAMGESTDAPLTPKIARELCLRTGAKAVLEGSIARVGAHYSVILNADRCTDGESLTSVAAQASDKGQVLPVLGKVATEMRTKLGESLATVEKYDTPLEQATTPSLEALQAYSLGRRIMDLKGDYAAAVPMFQSATRLDARFAMAYAASGTAYYALEESTKASESLKVAYDLRQQVSPRERFEIEALYHWFATGDLEKAVEVYEEWSRAYPRDDVPPNNLGVLYQELGRNEETLEKAREAFRLDPDSGLSYGNLVDSYLHLGQLNEARATAEEALAKGFDSPHLRFYLHRIAFLGGDAEGMAQQLEWARGKQGGEELVRESQAHVEAYYGRLKKARELVASAVASTVKALDNEAAATYQMSLAQSEVAFGFPQLAREDIAAAIQLAPTRDTRALAANVMALLGNTTETEKLAKDFAREAPQDTNITKILLPVIRASIELRRENPGGAIELLKTVAPYELGSDDNLYSAYLRGQAYLMLGRGAEAGREFQKQLDHRPIYQKNERAALSQLGLARAYSLQGNTTKAKAAYQDFLRLWKDADPDIPILKQATTEYAKLH